MDYKQKRFEQMVNQNKGTIYTVCYMFSKDSDEVADLFQETLINLWKGMPEKDEISNIKGWIYRVSLNTCISLNRKKKSRLTVAEKIIKYKRFGNNWLKFSIPFLVLWVIVFFHYLSGNACSDFTHGVIYGGIVGLAVGLTLGIINYRQSMKRLNGILKQIDEMKEEQ